VIRFCSNSMVYYVSVIRFCSNIMVYYVFHLFWILIMVVVLS
jgi:hypothetical protein